MTKTSNIARRRTTALSDGGTDYAAKRGEIIQVAARFFKENGFKATRLADIAAAADLDRATLYYYIGSKEELFREGVENVLDANLAFAKGLRENDSLGPTAKLEAFARQLMQSYSENYPYPYVYIQEQMHQVASKTAPWAGDILDKTRQMESMVMWMLRDSIDAGELRSDLPVRLVANALFGMFNWTHRWYQPGQVFDADAVANSFIAIFLDGMRAR